jgi:hypothetical protein
LIGIKPGVAAPGFFVSVSANANQAIIKQRYEVNTARVSGVPHQLLL